MVPNMNGISQLHYWFSEVLLIQDIANRTYPYNETQECNNNITLECKRLEKSNDHDSESYSKLKNFLLKIT